MYNIIQLNDKDLSELQSIAKELGIKKTDSLKKEDLVYKILDEQAIVGATQKVAAEKPMKVNPVKDHVSTLKKTVTRSILQPRTRHRNWKPIPRSLPPQLPKQ